MCGRYYRSSSKQSIAEAVRAKAAESYILAPDYNIAPTTFQPVIRENRDTGEREMVSMRWGLIPYFAKAAADFKGFSTINAKAETLTSKAMWRGPFERRRCLVPVDGYYEWKKLDAKTKQPIAYTLTTGGPFAFAGLWDAWKDPATGDWLQTYTVITTEANELAAEVHNRMPVILHPQDYGRWLSKEEGQWPPEDLLDSPPVAADDVEEDPVRGAARIGDTGAAGRTALEAGCRSRSRRLSNGLPSSSSVLSLLWGHP